jgi:hypothetical protein
LTHAPDIGVAAERFARAKTDAGQITSREAQFLTLSSFDGGKLRSEDCSAEPDHRIAVAQHDGAFTEELRQLAAPFAADIDAAG